MRATLVTLFILATVVPGRACATEAYARREGLRCGICHLEDTGRSPLNQYGRRYRGWGSWCPDEEGQFAVQGAGLKLTPAQERILYRKYLKVGKRLFHYDHLGHRRIACACCHSLEPVGAAHGQISGLGRVFERYPRYRWQPGTVATLEQAVNICIVTRMQGQPLKLGSRSMVALLTYLKSR